MNNQALSPEKPATRSLWGERGKETKQMPRILTGALVAAAVLAFVGCGAKEKVADAAEPPAYTAEPYEAEPPADAPGKVLLETRCVGCHDLGPVEKEKADRAGWEKVVDDMIEKGAKLNDEEKATLLDYLAENYGP
jgi:cytochrome c5